MAILNDQIRTIGLYQPYASLMLHDKLESRWVAAGKKPPFPIGKYVIYSTKKAYSINEFKHLAGQFFERARNIITREETATLFGYALATGDLVSVEPIKSFTQCEEAFYYPPTPLDDSNQFGYNGHLLWGLRFKNVERIVEPFYFRGKQGVGFFPDELLPLIQNNKL